MQLNYQNLDLWSDFAQRRFEFISINLKKQKKQNLMLFCPEVILQSISLLIYNASEHSHTVISWGFTSELFVSIGACGTLCDVHLINHEWK